MEIVITATPVTNVSIEADWLVSVEQPTFTRVITLHNEDFIACGGKMVHGLGYHFNSQENSSGAYNITFTKRMLWGIMNYLASIMLANGWVYEQ